MYRITKANMNILTIIKVRPIQRNAACPLGEIGNNLFDRFTFITI